MTDKQKTITAKAITVGIIYAIMVFIMVDHDPLEWHWFAKVVFVLTTLKIITHKEENND